MGEVRVVSVSSLSNRVVVGRVFPGTDLIEGILRICEDHGISSGSIDLVLGSLRKFTFVYPIRDDQNKMGVKYCDPVEIDGPIELLCGNGIVGVASSGGKALHLHAVVADRNGRVYGGHVLQGNPVLVTVEVVIRELSDVNVIRGLDEETGFTLFSFSPKGGV
ncbi:MAG: DNA-binding protein [Synergistetes bacterium]|nr:DNA-binding protein [Synergistota bacterium]MCX8127219.1 DNA-binding protein [Synergistota bacterium]MDW8191895.1 DNA-binding protein [Synergistota bacterium]